MTPEPSGPTLWGENGWRSVVFWELLSLYWFGIIVYCNYCPPEENLFGRQEKFWYVFACFNLGLTAQQWLGK